MKGRGLDESDEKLVEERAGDRLNDYSGILRTYRVAGASESSRSV